MPKDLPGLRRGKYQIDETGAHTGTGDVDLQPAGRRYVLDDMTLEVTISYRSWHLEATGRLRRENPDLALPDVSTGSVVR